MNGFEKFILLIVLILWTWGGLYLIKNFNKIFGPHPDDPSETPGARSYGQTQIWSVWIGMIAIGIYYLLN